MHAEAESDARNNKNAHPTKQNKITENNTITHDISSMSILSFIEKDSW